MNSFDLDSLEIEYGCIAEVYLKSGKICVGYPIIIDDMCGLHLLDVGTQEPIGQYFYCDLDNVDYVIFYKSAKEIE